MKLAIGLVYQEIIILYLYLIVLELVLFLLKYIKHKKILE